MKLKYFLIATACIYLIGNAKAQSPDPGPYYFVSDNENGYPQIYPSEVVVNGISTFVADSGGFGGTKIIQEYSLLAALLGDNPATLLQPGQTLVDSIYLRVGGVSYRIQPFVHTVEGSTEKKNLPIGTNLKKFFDDPLEGATFDLTLPFLRTNMGLSDGSALVRVGGGNVWHCAVDFDITSGSWQGFEVLAPADGIIEGYVPTGSSMTIKHSASNGKAFLTFYQHLDPSTISKRVGDEVKRGEVIARIATSTTTPLEEVHLHFGVAVKGPEGTINGLQMPEQWYMIDPLGVYDYRRNKFDQTTYNYLPNNAIIPQVRGIIHAYVFRTNPLLGSLICQPPGASPFINSVTRQLNTGNQFQPPLLNIQIRNLTTDCPKKVVIEYSQQIPDPRAPGKKKKVFKVWQELTIKSFSGTTLITTAPKGTPPAMATGFRVKVKTLCGSPVRKFVL